MSFSKGYLSISQRRRLITLLPKKNKPRQYLKNWRPFTLLFCDYKIAAKSIATRLKKVLPHLINHDQTGFLKGRFIGENIRLINNVIDYAEKQDIPGLLLFVAFEKAFDTLEWTFERFPSTTSKSLLNLGLNYYIPILQAAYKTMAGLPTFFSLVEGSDKAAPYRHTSLFYV